MAEETNNTKLGKKKNKEDNSVNMNESDDTDSIDKFDWDFILDREWSRTKK